MIWASTSSDGDGLQNSLLIIYCCVCPLTWPEPHRLLGVVNSNKGKLTLKLKGPVKKLGLQKPLSTDRFHATPHWRSNSWLERWSADDPLLTNIEEHKKTPKQWRPQVRHSSSCSFSTLLPSVSRVLRQHTKVRIFKIQRCSMEGEKEAGPLCHTIVWLNIKY